MLLATANQQLHDLLAAWSMSYSNESLNFCSIDTGTIVSCFSHSNPVVATVIQSSHIQSSMSMSIRIEFRSQHDNIVDKL